MDVSSAKYKVSFVVFVDSPSKYKIANNGPNTEPCGHPDWRVLRRDEEDEGVGDPLCVNGPFWK